MVNNNMQLASSLYVLKSQCGSVKVLYWVITAIQLDSMALHATG